MTAKTTLKVSQDYEVLTPKFDKAFFIPCDEWDIWKSQIDELTMEPWLFHTLGSLLLGASLATAISIWTGAISTSSIANAVVIAWSVVAVCGLTGLACMYFANKERRVHRSKAQYVINQMKLIEKRFEREKS